MIVSGNLRSETTRCRVVSIILALWTYSLRFRMAPRVFHFSSSTVLSSMLVSPLPKKIPHTAEVSTERGSRRKFGQRFKKRIYLRISFYAEKGVQMDLFRSDRIMDTSDKVITTDNPISKDTVSHGEFPL